MPLPLPLPRPLRPRLTAGLLAAALVPGGVLLLGTGAAGASDAELGSAAAFAVLASSTVTNTGSSVVTGDLGLSPGSAVTGFPPGILIGAQHISDAVAIQARIDARTAYTTAAGLPVTQAVSAELGGLTLTPGVYAGPTLGLTGTLTLDAAGDSSAAFVLRSTSTLITGSASRVLLVNGANPCNVTWVVGSSATLGTTTTFVGTVLAQASVTATTGASVQGRLMAHTGAVTLDTNRISRPVCTSAASPAPVASTAAPTATPSASTSPTPTPAATPTPTPVQSATPSVAPAATPAASAAPSASASAAVVPTPAGTVRPDLARPGPSARPFTSSSRQLPRTGTDAETVLAWGALLALGGAAMTFAGSRRAR